MTMDTIHWKEGGLGGTIYRTQGAKALAYILEPEPVTDKVASVAEELSLTLVSISGMDWNRDLSPWKAEKVFKGEEDFSGGADDFMEKLENKVFPAIEEMAGPPAGPAHDGRHFPFRPLRPLHGDPVLCVLSHRFHFRLSLV